LTFIIGFMLSSSLSLVVNIQSAAREAIIASDFGDLYFNFNLNYVPTSQDFNNLEQMPEINRVRPLKKIKITSEAGSILHKNGDKTKVSWQPAIYVYDKDNLPLRLLSEDKTSYLPNNRLTPPQTGKIYLPIAFMSMYGADFGDTYIIEAEEDVFEYEVSGFVEDITQINMISIGEHNVYLNSVDFSEFEKKCEEERENVDETESLLTDYLNEYNYTYTLHLNIADEYGNFWQIGTMTISQKHMFERRLGLFPVFLDEDGTYYAVTKYGDYPLTIPQNRINRFEDIFPEWMLLTYNKQLTVSSSVDSLPPDNMTDENIRTYWAAASGNEHEYAMVDMGDFYDVYAVQINFAEHYAQIRGREKEICYRYTVEYSLDGTTWEMLADRSANITDNSHVYLPIDKVLCRYLKVKNIEVPGGHFAISGFRAFGKGSGPLPGSISSFVARRDPNDKRSVTLTWSKADHATGYNISYGTEKNKLYLNHMVYRDTTVVINSLNSNLDYYFTIESFNENGITANDKIVQHFE